MTNSGGTTTKDKEHVLETRIKLEFLKCLRAKHGGRSAQLRLMIEWGHSKVFQKLSNPGNEFNIFLSLKKSPIQNVKPNVKFFWGHNPILHIIVGTPILIDES